MALVHTSFLIWVIAVACIVLFLSLRECVKSTKIKGDIVEHSYMYFYLENKKSDLLIFNIHLDASTLALRSQ